MADKTDIQAAETLPDLDDLLQCPVCYEIPTGQIFQCNEGHHVCGRCKARLDMCPVCRALFFGTRNYAMEELIANVRKLRAFKLGGKITTGSDIVEPDQEVESSPAEPEPEMAVEEESNAESSNSSTARANQSCKGLFRCLCCKNGNGVRLPSARLLNHLRYHHAPELIEGQSENGQYVQAWQFSTVPGRLVTAVRVADMGIFFLNIEINDGAIYAWLSMAASPWVAHEFSYTITISGNDREAIFSDCVWSVRACEGSLKKRGHCLVVRDRDAEALASPAAVSGKLTLRRTPPEQLAQMPPPRAVLRVASRVNNGPRPDLQPFLQGLHHNVARLSAEFRILDREAEALARSEAELRARIEGSPRNGHVSDVERALERPLPPLPVEEVVSVEPEELEEEEPSMSRYARRRLRRRLRGTLNLSNEGLDTIEAVENIAGPVDIYTTSNRRPGNVRNRARASNAPHNSAPNAPRANVHNVPRDNAPNAPRSNVPNAPRGNAPNTPRSNVPNALRDNAPNAPRSNVPNAPSGNAPNTRSNVPNAPRDNASDASRANAPNVSNAPRNNGPSIARNNAAVGHSRNNNSELQNGFVHMTGLAIVQPATSPPVAPPSVPGGARDGHPQNNNPGRTNKKSRRQCR